MTSHLNQLVPVWKPIGLTPLRCVEEFRLKYPQYRLTTPRRCGGETVSYAGRLDPMAEGILLLLVGDENKRRREYEHLDKEYEVDILCGFSTDTGDLMGIVTKTQMSKLKCPSSAQGYGRAKQIKFKNQNEKDMSLRGAEQRSNLNIEEDVERILPSFIGTFEQRYPVYSAAKVEGKPLYWWARKGRLGEIKVPTHTVRIDDIALLGLHTISTEELEKYIVSHISKVRGDFRQEEIIQVWRNILKDIPHRTHQLISIRVVCGSGTYMRTLVEDIGTQMDIPLCAYNITRTRVGEYDPSRCQ